ncbi:MAG: PDZ domain-containing protein [Candidatus Aminicenantes bacterium]|nr:PDZ domain-containing protein [Candidatus Aminicenantes bacterium]
MKKKLFLLLGILFVFGMQPLMQQDIWTHSLRKMSSMVSLIEQNYYKEVKNEDLAYSTIRGMLYTLDPHSYFLDPTSLSTLTEDYTGKYHGLGILIQKHGEDLKVISPIEGTPAYRLGIQPGDVISHIEGESTKPISSYQAMQRLRGKPGTSVTITITREGLDEPMDLTIARAEIPLYSIPYAFMLQDDIGYIYINRFAETTTKEFREKMKLLQEQGMQKLIIDFRLNGGGTFIQSLEMSEELLAKDAGIVSIKGRNSYYNRVFRANRNGRFQDIPLVIVIHRGTASAPEIVSGAVKDNDRGLIVGERSWGKGLVQTVFRLGPEAAVALTTARYYTPSGRSIQRDYSELEDYLSFEQTPEEEREVTYTAGGRKVLGQGGISPDYEVEFSYHRLTYWLLLRGGVFSYARKFHEEETPLAKSLVAGGALPSDFEVDQEVLNDFRAYIEETYGDSFKRAFKSKDFEEAKPQLVRELERQIFSNFLGVEEGEKIFRLHDPVIIKAIEVLPEAAQLLHR